MTQKTLLFFTLIVLVLAICFLAWTEHRDSALTEAQDWWAVSFVSPRTDDNTLHIENYTATSDFTIVVDGTSEPHTVVPATTATIALPQKKKITVEILHDGDSKKLYK